MGQQVSHESLITVDSQAHVQQEQQLTVLLNKPIGYVSGQPEHGHEPAVSLFKANNRWRNDQTNFRFHSSHLRGLAPAGRLDNDSEGLLVLT